MIVPDFPNYGLNFSSFLSRDRIFVWHNIKIILL
jgi:hypothetical protein